METLIGLILNLRRDDDDYQRLSEKLLSKLRLHENPLRHIESRLQEWQKITEKNVDQAGEDYEKVIFGTNSFTNYLALFSNVFSNLSREQADQRTVIENLGREWKTQRQQMQQMLNNMNKLEETQQRHEVEINSLRHDHDQQGKKVNIVFDTLQDVMETQCQVVHALKKLDKKKFWSGPVMRQS